MFAGRKKAFAITWPEMTDIVQAYQSVSSLSVYPLEFLIILSLPVKASGISKFAWVLFIKQSMKYALKFWPLV
jgi:hypothetical protein